MAFGLLGIWIGGLAILCSGFFYTRAMLMALREQALTPLTPLPKTGRGGTPGRRQKSSPLPAVLGRGAGGEGLPSDHFRRLGRRAFCAVQLFLFAMLTLLTPFKVMPQRPEGVHLAAWPAFKELLVLGPLAIIPR